MPLLKCPSALQGDQDDHSCTSPRLPHATKLFENAYLQESDAVAELPFKEVCFTGQEAPNKSTNYPNANEERGHLCFPARWVSFVKRLARSTSCCWRLLAVLIEGEKELMVANIILAVHSENINGVYY